MSNASGALVSRAHARPIPRYDRGRSKRRLLDPRPSLADDLDFLRRGDFDMGRCDPDLEAFTWPDLMDQTAIGDRHAWSLLGDDAEPDDDDDHGIDDLPHDPRDEDGV